LQTFTTLEKVHVDDLIVKMKKCVSEKFTEAVNASNIVDLTKTNFFDQF